MLSAELPSNQESPDDTQLHPPQPGDMLPPSPSQPADLLPPSPLGTKEAKDALAYHKKVWRSFGMDDPFDIKTPWEEMIEDVLGPGSSV